MGRAKDIRVEPISSADANRIIRKLHYSGKVVSNSQIYFGVFLNGMCGGALQFGPPMWRDFLVGLVRGTSSREFLELNRMALADWLPRNGESRSLAVAMRIIRKSYPHIKWVVSFADACRCGDGTIYRAAGFLLTAIKKNVSLRVDPETGKIKQSMAAFHDGFSREFSKWEKLDGFQIRYIYFLHPGERKNLTVPVLSYDAIRKHGASMYRGVRVCDAAEA